MEIEITGDRENPLLERREVRFRVSYPGAGVPDRQEVRSKLVALLDSKKELTVLDHMKPEYGRHSAVGYVKVYASADALKVESNHKAKRNFEPRQKKPAAAEAKAEGKEGK